MNRTPRVAPLILLALLMAAAAVSVHLSRPATAAKGGIVADHYIVTFKPGVDPATKAKDKAKAYGLQVRHVYDSAINGFAGFIPPGQLKKLASDPDVASIVEDRYVTVLADLKPTGIRRSLADRNPISQIGSQSNPISSDIAVVDTGIDVDHPDLNVAGGVNCVPGETSYDDEHGHGTHVAGTVGALDNGAGVVGVAPGVRLWAVRVLDASGSGQFSDVMCGVDWITENAATIDVANMSLGGEAPKGTCTDGGLHQAVCRSVAAGVTYIVAAGNSTMDASGFVPASYDEVITVSAIQDFDGAPGGKASDLFLADDALAYFSNYGAPVDIAAPGYDIYSTWIGGGYNYASGTSMASPHVAGAAGIVRHLEPGASPDRVRAVLLDLAWPQASADGFTDDADGFAEPLLNVGSIGGDPLPPPPPGCTLGASEGTVNATVRITCENFGYGDYIRVYWDNTSSTQRGFFTTTGGSGSGTFTVPAAPAGLHQVIAQGSTSEITVSVPFTVLPQLKLSAASGKVGGSVTATLSGYPAATNVELFWDDGSSPVKTGATSSTGALTLFVTVPDGVTGQHRFRATTGSSLSEIYSADAAFAVVPGVSTSLSYVRVGATVTATPRGFAAGERIDIVWQDQAGVRTTIGQATASSLGSASAAFAVPDAAKGIHTLEAVGSSGSTATTPLTVSPAMTLSGSSGIVGSSLTLTLTGGGSAEPVSVRWYETWATTSAVSTLSTASTSTTGRAAITLAVPDTIGGLHRVEIVGTATGTLYGYYTVNSAVAFSPASGLPGSTASGLVTGYPANEPITVKWYITTTSSTTIAAAVTSGQGSAAVTFTVPSDAAVGEHKVEAIGDVSLRRVSTTFVVESSGPPPPVDPYCSLDPASGPVGTAVVVSCANFAKSEYIGIYWDDAASTRRTSVWTGNTGAGKATFYVPDANAGEHQVIAIGTTSALRVQESFTVSQSLKLSAATSKVGTYVSATVKGFGAGESVTLTWNGSTVLAKVTASAVGSAGVGFFVPTATKGQYTVGAAGETSGLTASATLAVEPSVTLSPSSGYVGSNVAILLRGHAGNESVTLWWYPGSGAAVSIAMVTVDALGSGSVNWAIPAATKGYHRVEGTGDAGSLASTNFYVSPRLTLSTPSATVGTVVDFALSGFAAGEAIRLDWFDSATASTAVASVTASADGAATGSFTIPEATNGSHKVQATGATSTAAYYFTVKPAMTLAPTAAAPGASVTASLTGYRAGETVNLSWFSTATASSVIASGVASSAGSAAITFLVPNDASIGNHRVDGAGQASYARSSATFAVQQAATSTGSTPIQSVTRTVDVAIADDFSQATADGSPTGWSIVPGSNPAAGIKVRGGVDNARLNVAAETPGGVWLIREGAAFTSPDAVVRLHFIKASGEAGLVLAWNGPDNYIAVVADAGADRIEVLEVAAGVVRTRFATPEGSVVVGHGRDYWLRAETGSDGAGNRWVSLYWSTDGETFQPVGAVVGLANVAGRVGLTAGGRSASSVDFDDVVVQPGRATTPVQITEPEPSVTPEPTHEPTLEPTQESTPEPTATETPLPTPTQEPMATSEPTSMPEPTATVEPTATETPVPDSSPVVDEDEGSSAP